MPLAQRSHLLAQIQYHITKGEMLLRANAFMSAAIQYDRARELFLTIPVL